LATVNSRQNEVGGEADYRGGRAEAEAEAEGYGVGAASEKSAQVAVLFGIMAVARTLV
jgi:hypothetical protein